MRSRLSRLIQNVIKIMWILNTRVAFDLAELQTIWNIDGANTERYCDYVQSVALESANHSSDHCLWWCFWCFCWKNISNRKKMPTSTHTCKPKMPTNFSNWLSFSRLFSLQWNTSFIYFSRSFTFRCFSLSFHSLIRHLWLEQ